MPILRSIAVLVAFAFVAAACSSDSAEPATTALAPVTPAPTTTTTVQTTPPPSTSTPPTTPAPTTTSTSTSTIPPLASILLDGDLPEGLEPLVTDLYNWLADRRHTGSGITEGLRTHLADVVTPMLPQRAVRAVIEEVRDGEEVAVIHVGNDLLFGVDDGSGWKIVGAAVEDAALRLGDEPLFLFVIGSDARPGQLQPRLRADSLHIIALNPSANAGTIVGFPRDSYITQANIAAGNEFAGLDRSDLPSGSRKWTNLMSRRGPEIMLGVAKVLTDLPIDGYVLTGFLGFTDLLKAIGGIEITLESRISAGAIKKAFPAGPQSLTANRTLVLARIRKTIKGGDFARSLNQGVIILATMAMLQERGIDGLPMLLKTLVANTWTDLSTEDLLRFSVAGLVMDPGSLDNLVMPGRVSNINGASVVLLDQDELERISENLADDGILTAEED